MTTRRDAVSPFDQLLERAGSVAESLIPRRSKPPAGVAWNNYFGAGRPFSKRSEQTFDRIQDNLRKNDKLKTRGGRT
jgi:hypothetical protein